jgi:hypothetical protein
LQEPQGSFDVVGHFHHCRGIAIAAVHIIIAIQ